VGLQTSTGINESIGRRLVRRVARWIGGLALPSLEVVLRTFQRTNGRNPNGAENPDPQAAAHECWARAPTAPSLTHLGVGTR